MNRSLLLIAITLVLVVSPALAQDAPPKPCSAPESSQFDFWVGNWNLTWEGGSGTNRVESILGGCVIQENFSGDMGNDTRFNGMSVSTYDVRRGVWRQTWVDNQGSYLDFEGGMAGDRMILTHEGQFQGEPALSRMVFRNITDGSLDWDWERSTDGGETWSLLWGIHYERAE